MSEVGFVKMGESASGGDVRAIGVGKLGHGFMGKATRTPTRRWCT